MFARTREDVDCDSGCAGCIGEDEDDRFGTEAEIGAELTTGCVGCGATGDREFVGTDSGGGISGVM